MMPDSHDKLLFFWPTWSHSQSIPGLGFSNAPIAVHLVLAPLRIRRRFEELSGYPAANCTPKCKDLHGQSSPVRIGIIVPISHYLTTFRRDFEFTFGE